MDKMRVSVIIPTYNRAKLLSLTVNSFLNQDYPKESYEIIVSNNNSDDNTDEIVQNYSQKYSNIKYLFEPRQGVHYARNSAAKIAKGEILYFTDDDMIADPFLLKNLIKLFSSEFNIGTATGQVFPKWEEEPPRWVKKYCINALLSLRKSNNIFRVSKNNIGVYSCHQAILKEAFIKAGGFNPENTMGVWLGDGEDGLNEKIKKSGYLFGETCESVIYHIIPKERMTQKYLNKRIANQGNCDSYTYYRAKKPNQYGLIKQIINHLFNYMKKFFRFVLCWILCKGSWHLHLAYSFYYINRIRYDIRLIKDNEWRSLVLIDNWLDL